MAVSHHLAGLNPAQKEAVECVCGPLLVVAGAGSGKTRVITHRIAHLIEKGVAPHNILAVTFTNKAAREMAARIGALLHTDPARARAALESRPTVATFHSLGVQIIRQQHRQLGLRRNFTIYDRSDQVRAVKTALEAAGYSPKEFEPRVILSIISRAKGDACPRERFEAQADTYPKRVAARVWAGYERLLADASALDFDDLLLTTFLLLSGTPAVRRAYQERFVYLHIDEYQDTNKVQFQIAKLLAGERANICAVGDVDQNIYSWRGAQISHTLSFAQHFPNAKVVTLEENYRSTQTIISASNEIIEKNVHRPEKRVFTNNHRGEPITLYAAPTAADEAAYVAQTAQACIAQGAAPSDIAVLFRTNFQSRALEEAFLRAGVPYQVVGTRFFERKEVKDVLAFVRLALNRTQTADLARIINVPPRGIGKVTLLKLIEGRRAALSGAIARKAEAFEHLLDALETQLTTRPLAEALRYTLTHTGIEAHLKNGGEEGLERLENLRELVTLATGYHEYEPEEAVERFLEDAALQSDQDELKNKEEEDAVRLMTVHAAKGLEFPYVFITGLEEGLFPHERLSDERMDEEEERRLFYVALTRAEKKVFLTFALLRTIFGAQRVNMPSSFLHDISASLIDVHDHIKKEPVIELL